ncbi:MAG: type II CRISPR RNA-guided endonuclease Cas9, partial [Muribaculaceae bacterium]|nr:type II CRISPR RNA-guided endonuclease Cas9 [Muribaculaceae bacterium]
IRLINIHNKGRKSKSDTSPSLFDTEFENIKSKDFKLTQYEYVLSLEERRRIVEYLNTHEKLTSKELLKLIGLTPNDGFRPDKAVGKGIKGNETFIKLAKVLENVPEKDKLLQFNLNLQDTDKVNQLTGEIIQEVSPEFLNQPLYTLWHTIYSIDDKDDLKRVLGENFHLSDDIAEELSNLDFKTPGFANRSARFLRRILPLMMDGYGYAEACETIGIKHSDSLSKEEREDRILVNPIPILPKNSLRQPIVEKIINQMIHIVNDLTSRFGTIDEVRVELARCLKQSADERARDSKNMGERERKNNDLSKKIEELGLSPSKSRIQKFKLWEETGHKCMYCDQPIGVVNFLRGMASEVEHIIPRSIFFDDSLSNKTCACQKCNKEKNNRTAYDFMKSKSEAEFTSYIEKVENLFASNSISRTKRNRLLTSESEIPQDFLERDLRLTQYISKKTCEILRSGIRNVYSSTGSVTDFFRHLWGYDKILQEINIPRYEKADLVIEEEYEHKGQIHKRRKIVDWSKRKDHRHHAIDALVVALTRQGYIQRLNRLSAEHGNMYNEMINEGIEFKEALSLLNNWAETRPHFPTEIVKDEISKIAVSVKKGKKFLTPGKRSVKRQGKKRIVQKELLIPRGPLHQESVVGKILINAGHKNLKFAFSHPELIKDSAIKDEILKRITQNDGSWEKACKSCKKNPIILDQTNSALENVECFEEKFVMKYPIASIKSKHINSIVDDKVREVITQRFEECGNNEKKFEQSLSERPIILFEGQAPVKSIRRIVDLKPDSVVAIRKNSNNENIGFAKSGNNHHVAFYKDSNGKYQATVTSFWIAVKRHKSGLPVIIDNPREAYDTLIELGNETLIEELLPGMPLPDWDFVESLKMNDTFILGMTDEEYSEAINNNNTAKLLNNLYRVQKLSLSEYVFRLHTDTSSDTTVKAKSDKEMDLFQIFKAPSSFFNSHPRRVKISRTGEINYD